MTKKNISPLENPNIQKIFSIFKNKIYLVGGATRDYLLNKKIKDFDFAIRAPYDDVKKILEKNNIKYETISKNYGVIKVFLGRDKFEITSFRTDIENYGRQAKCKYTSSMKKDARRRDFTANAIYMDEDGNFIDPVNGIKDLQNKTLRFIGNPLIRIQEDALRIIRYFRFLSDFPNIDKKSYDACKNNQHLLEKVNPQKVDDELKKC